MKYTPAFISTITLLSAWLTLTSATCYDYLLINSRGTFEPQKESCPLVNMISQVMREVPNGSSHDTVYPASLDLSELRSPPIGAMDIEKVIQNGLVNCPNQKYALLGYSQGATATNMVLQKFSPTGAVGKAIKAVVYVGNAQHVPNAKGNKDEQCGTRTAAANGFANMPTAPDLRVPGPWYETGKVRDICYVNDKVCNGPGWRNGLLSHLLYWMPSVQACGAQFLIAQLS